MANNPIYKKTLIKGVAGESATDTTAPVGGVYMYDGVTIPEGYEEVDDVTGTRLIRKTTPSIENTRPKVSDNIDYDINTEGTSFSIECIKQVFSEYYPIGAIYISVNAINPNTFFGGTWQQIKDRYLVACGDTFSIEETGGNTTATTYTGGYVGETVLNVNQLPSHKHQYLQIGLVQGTKLTVDQIPNHVHAINFKTGENIAGGEDYNQYYRKWEETTKETSGYGVNNNQPHYHSRQLAAGTTGAAGGTETHSHNFTGDYSTFSTMPKYLAVNVWVRTA